MSRTWRGAAAGTVAAVFWIGAEPLVRAVTGRRYSDVRLLGRLVSRRRWQGVGTAWHVANGAAFGAVFARLGGRGWRQGLLAAEVENAALWPAMAVADRLHPDRVSGAWPRPLVSDPRVAAHEVIVHALFGATLGAMLRDEA
ncbi:MAG: hypothetical protein AB1416_10540 [Actinomycetota bacterium]